MTALSFAPAYSSQARQQYQTAIQLRPDYVLARLTLAQLEVSRGEFEAGLKGAQEVVQKYDRNSLHARLIESTALVGQKKYKESRDLIEKMIKAAPSSPEAYFQLGVVNLSESKYKEAEDAFRRSYELNPANSRGLMGMVETNMAQKKPEAAMQLLQAESRKAPNRLDLLMAMGSVALRGGKFDEAIGDYQKLLDGLDKTDKARGEIHMRMGEAYRLKGDSNNAIAALQKAREFLPNNEVVLQYLAVVLDLGGQRKKASDVYETLIKINPNNGVALNNEAFIMAESGANLEQALSYAQRAKQLLPNMAEVADTLGWIYLKLSQNDAAIGTFQELIQKVPAHSTYHYHLAMAFSNKGDKGKAIAELKEAMKYSPPSDELQEIKGMLGRIGG